MSTLYPTPPRTSEVLPKVKDLLAAGAGLTTVLGGSGRVFVSKGNRFVESPPPADNWRRIVLFLPKRMLDQPEHLDRVTSLVFYVRADVMAPDGAAFDPHLAIDVIQEEAFKLLEGKSISMTYAKQAMRIHRVGRSNGVFQDPDDGFWFASCKYKTVLSAAS